MIKPADDASPAEWLTRSAGDFYTLHLKVPEVFESYARVFHPASLGDRDVRWADVAAANERTMHGAAEWGQITGSWRLSEQECLWDREPHTGPTPKAVAVRLNQVLAEHTTTTESCWFAIWEGWGTPTVVGAWVRLREGSTAAERAEAKHRAAEARARRQAAILAWDSIVRGAPFFALPHRGMHLLHGSISDLARLYEDDANGPDIWWPEDRAWCVGNDTDLMSTYVGASAEAVQAIVEDAELEALEIPPGQSVTCEADTVNPPAGRPPF